MKLLTIYLFLSAFYVNIIQSYRILGLFPFPFKSHMVMYEAIMKELAARGHEVDVVNHFPQENPLERYNDIDISYSIPVSSAPFEFLQTRLKNVLETLKLVTTDLGASVCDIIFNLNETIELKNTQKKYDLIITEIFGTDCMLGFAHHFQVPVIGTISSVILPWAGDRIGNPDNPSYIPNYFAPYISPMTLRERIYNAILLLSTKIGYDSLSFENSNRIARKFFGNDLPDLRDLAWNVSLILVNSHFSINGARPLVPNLIEVGGLHMKVPKPLPAHLAEFFQLPPECQGVIYLNTGSVVQSETFPEPKLKLLFEAFEELPYKILWKADKEKFSKHLEIPSNIHFEIWVPQFDILCHPNLKLFITHGGLLSTQEAIYCGVPRLGIPFFADQRQNLKSSEVLEMAIMLEFDQLTKKAILEASEALLEDPKYKKNTERASRIYQDRPLTALDTAIYWIEYVIKYKGAPHLRSVGADLPWYQYYLVDVIFILSTCCAILITSMYYLFYLLVKMLMHWNGRPVNKVKLH